MADLKTSSISSPDVHPALVLRYCLAIGCLAWVGSILVASEPSAPEPSVSASRSEALQAVRFELDVQPILTARGCNSGPCHGKSRGQNGFALSLLGFDADMDFRSIVTDARGRRVSPASPSESLLLQKATGELPHGGGIRFTRDSEEYALLQRWIQMGFARTTASDPRLVRVSIQPEPRSLAPGEELQLSVTAHYSDGSTRDVTRSSAFQSNEPAIVRIAEDGKLRAGDLPGEATIMARYMGNIATWSSAIPRPEPVSADVYASLPRKNFIDEAVYGRLQQLQLVPSRPASDAQFLRRATLDVLGRLPTVDEAAAFLQSDEPNKRESLVDRLLEMPEYADYWANKWADLLRPNPYRVGIKAVMSLDGWIRDSFRKNMPHNQFVRELLTAKGSTWRNGAVTVFRDRREPDEIVTIASQLFMGVRLECAKCHQHPFEVYGQKDFYSLAAFFAKVGYKGVGLSPPISGGEEVILVRADGSVKHPLTGQVLPPTMLRGGVAEISDGEDPRSVLVDWLTSPSHPTFAHVAVNRMWADLFGVGIVDPVDDFRATNPPSNPKLIDALATHFREVGFDNKKMLRSMLLSHVYALDSAPNATNAADNRNFSRHYRQRLRAEVLADAISQATETSHRFSGMPPGTRAMQLWTHRTESELLDAFGRPDPNQDPPCERIPESTVVQALHMMNAPAIAGDIAADEGRCRRLAASERVPAQIVEELYLATFSRFPTPEESKSLEAEFAKPDQDRGVLIQDILWSMLNSPEFTHKD